MQQQQQQQQKAYDPGPTTYSTEPPVSPLAAGGAKLKGAAGFAGKLLGRTATAALPTVGMVFLGQALSRSSGSNNQSNALNQNYQGNYQNAGSYPSSGNYQNSSQYYAANSGANGGKVGYAQAAANGIVPGTSAYRAIYGNR